MVCSLSLSLVPVPLSAFFLTSSGIGSQIATLAPERMSFGKRISNSAMGNEMTFCFLSSSILSEMPVTVCKINQFFKGRIRREHDLIFCYLTDLAVISFNGICSIYKLTDSRSVLEVFGQFIPVVLP